MYSVKYLEYDPSNVGEFWTESRLVDDGFDIQIQGAQWLSAGTAVIEAKNSCLLRLVLPKAAASQSRYSDNKGRFSGRDCDFQSLGQVLFLPPGTEFQFYHGVSQFKSMICLFDPGVLGPLAGIEWCWEDCLNDGMLNLKSNYLQVSMERLAQEVAAPGFASQLHTECMLTGIAMDLHRQFLGSRTPGDCRGKLSLQQIRQLREMLDGDPDMGNSVAKLAQMWEMPPRKFSMLFKNTVGLTLRQYVAQSRIRKAKSLLLDHKVLIKQVSYQTGFQNPASFAAAFRKEVGMTPEAFRQEMRRVNP